MNKFERRVNNREHESGWFLPALFFLAIIAGGLLNMFGGWLIEFARSFL